MTLTELLLFVVPKLGKLIKGRRNVERFARVAEAAVAFKETDPDEAGDKLDYVIGQLLDRFPQFKELSKSQRNRIVEIVLGSVKGEVDCDSQDSPGASERTPKHCCHCPVSEFLILSGLRRHMQ